MFSEPGAGSDLASLTTRAERVDGGWPLTGQKVWTTLAHIADWGICLARTDPDAPKHHGISCFLVDMTTAGLDVRPLRELTGRRDVQRGLPRRRVRARRPASSARSTPAGRRPAPRWPTSGCRWGAASSFGPGVEALLATAADGRLAGRASTASARLLAESQPLAALGWRSTLRALAGADPARRPACASSSASSTSSACRSSASACSARPAAIDEGDGAAWIGGFLGNRCLSIAGGTSEIQRNVIAERLLGLPKDP